jgi:hypothetical protein
VKKPAPIRSSAKEKAAQRRLLEFRYLIRSGVCYGSSLPLPAPPGEQATGREDQARQSSTGGGGS